MNIISNLLAHEAAVDTSLDPAPFFVTAFGVLYIAGVLRAGRDRPWKPTRGTILAFAGAFATLLAALAWPVKQLAETSVAWHMAQHLLLIAVAAPLLVAAQPFLMVMRLLPDGSRRRVERGWRRLVGSTVGHRWYWWAVGSFVVYMATMGIWHLPAIYDDAVANVWVHGIEHVMFTWSAFVFWWVLAGLDRRREYGAGVLLVFFFSLGSMALGVVLTFIDRPLYELGRHRTLSAVMEDQQIAGVLMWAYCGLATAALALMLFANWLRWHERTSHRLSPHH